MWSFPLLYLAALAILEDGSLAAPTAASLVTVANAADAGFELLTASSSLSLSSLSSPSSPALAHVDLATSTSSSSALHAANVNATNCGAYESAAADSPMYIAVTAVFAVPRVSSRPLFNWTLAPEITPRIAVSAGIDGIECPEAVRAGIYATIFQNGTQQHVPFVEFGGRVYAVRIASVAPGEIVRVRVSIVQDDVANINWTNLNRTEEAFNRNIQTGSLCGKAVSWFVEDLVPYKYSPGVFFAAFEPVHFSLLEAERMDGNTDHFDSKTSSLTTANSLCKVDQVGTDMMVTST